MTLDFDGNIFQAFKIHDNDFDHDHVDVPEKKAFVLGDELWDEIE